MKPMPLLWGSQNHSDKLFCHSVHRVYLILTVGVAKTTRYCTGRLKSTIHFYEFFLKSY